ncbi:PREDICTED: RNA-binding protein 7 isoform X1 [Chrysochloris asiatica]|uniref:RNA-binding protein 7 n=1 Tax=Chrysochloris asiatica TaxID=185453 RepID=A0A9B0WI61_CHRAS|nr:PREDICTED: RNA-binding protein 7 isoform X1 [Chrysochloris asiatica]
MGAAAAEADRTLFVGNLETKVTEELLFELFHQAGPVVKVKIPKDKDGKPKQFAFVNFKHEVSVPYAMNLLNGIKLFGRPIKIQFRSGSSHASQDVPVSYSQHHTGNSSPTPSPTSPSRTMENMTSSTQTIQRSFSSPENFQRQAVMNNVLRHMSYGGKFGSPQLDQPGFSPTVPPHSHSFNQSSSSQWRSDAPPSQRKGRQNSHPYVAERHYSREQCYTDHSSDHYRGSREDFFYEDRAHDGWSHDYDNRRDNSRDGKWRSARH